MKSVALHNLGCKVNSYEMEVMQQFLQENGYKIVPFDQVADIYIVNTCTVTNIADRKSRQMLHRAKQKNPNAVVVAVGCYVQTGRDEIEKDECIDLAIGNNRKKDIVKILEEYLEEHGIQENALPDKTLGDTTIMDINRCEEYEEVTLHRTAEHTRAYIKIQDGCNLFCSYCAIPLARGRVRSRKQEDILREISGLVEAGYKEVVLTGIHISSYGLDFEKKNYFGDSRLIDLVEEIHKIPGLQRIRLGSLEPRIVTEETAERLAKMPKVCPHFHLSLQSGCDETLKRMNRHYTIEEYEKGVAALRNAYRRLGEPEPAITTDVIVGFPGETDEEFAQTKDFLERIAFYEMHVFKYSKRAGTRAAVMPDQISGTVMNQRSNELIALAGEQSVSFREKHLGHATEILLEEKKEIQGNAYWLGHTADYIKIALATQGKENLANKFVNVRVKEFLTDEILLAVIEE